MLFRSPLNVHGAARVEFVGADADFSAQAVFKAVGKARAGIDHAAGRIHFAQKALGVRVAAGEDGVGVVAAVVVDVGHGFIQPRHHLDGDDGRQVFGTPIFFLRGDQLRLWLRLQLAGRQTLTCSCFKKVVGNQTIIGVFLTYK